MICSLHGTVFLLLSLMKGAYHWKDNDGIYQSLTNIPVHFGGTGTVVFSWSLCDAPLLLLALLKAGIDYHKHLKPGADYLLLLHREN